MSDDLPFSGFCNSLLDCLAQLCCCADSTATSTQPRLSTVSTAPLTVPPRINNSRYDIEAGRGFGYPTRVQHIAPIVHQPRTDFQNRRTTSGAFDREPTRTQHVVPVVHQPRVDSQNRRTSSRAVDREPSIYNFIKFVPSTEQQVQPKGKGVTRVHGNLSIHSDPSTSRLANLVPQDLESESATDIFDETDWAFSKFDQAASSYREQAERYFKKSKAFAAKARYFRKANNPDRADYYTKQAKKQRKLGEETNHLAATAFLEENSKKHREDTIDLHFLFVKEALQALDIFLDEQISSLRNENLNTKSLSIITGWGKHNADGIPRIKPAVMERLRERGLKFSQINPGNLRVKILVHSYLTNDLPEV